MDNHVSNAINTDGKCTVMVCLSVSAKRHDNFRFVSAYLHRKTRKEPANRLVKNGGPVDYSKHSESISLTLNSFRSDGFVDVLDRLLFKWLLFFQISKPRQKAEKLLSLDSIL